MAAGSLKLVAYTDSTLVGGAEECFGNLLEYLGPHVEATVLGVDATVVETLAARRPGSGAVLVPPVRGKRDLRPIAAHVAAVRRLRPHVFHASLRSTVACQYGILAALVTPGVRTIAHEHSPIPVADPRQRRFKRLLSRRLGAHVAVGECSARMTEEVVGLPAGSVRAIHNGVPDVAVEPEQLPGPRPIVGALGRLSPEKGFDVFMGALRLLPAARGFLVGDGPERARLEGLAAELELGPRLTVTGRVPDSRRYIRAFDVLVVPSRFEGFPLVILEAMLAGVPVVASDVGSISEAVREEETGFLVPPGDERALAAALSRLLEDAELRRSLGARARALALERFTAPVMARAFAALYAEVTR